MGRGRALELILGCGELDAETAERWGYLNRALAPDELGPFVEELARRIASFPAEAVALAKQSVLNAETSPVEGLNGFLEKGGQTREVELRLGELTGTL
jgi:enoyl-CoA hydratase/carnithine racemase